MKDENEKETQQKKPKRFKFTKNIVITIGDDGELHLRRPTTKELNAYDKQAYPSNRKGFRADEADATGARIALFDSIFVKMVNFEDEDGPIPEDGLDRIPVDDKAYIILHHVQSKENIDVKN